MNLDYRTLSGKKKTLRYGGYSAVATVIVAVLLVLATLLIEMVHINIDLTPNQIYTPGDSTKDVLKELKDSDNEVEIYGLFSTGTEQYSSYAQVITLAEQYGTLSGKITYQTVDTLKNPDFIKPYLTSDQSITSVDDCSFLVVNPATKKFRLLTLYDFYTYMGESSTDIDAFSAEEAFTSAIQYVVSEHTPIVYQLMGHGETEVDSTFKSYMITTNCQYETLNLIEYGEKEIPVTRYSMIMIKAPLTDLTEDEYKMLRDYMERGGRMMVFISHETPNDLPNFARLLARFGISYNAGGNYLADTDMTKYSKNSQIILPEFSTSSDIVNKLEVTTAGVRLADVIYAVPLTVGRSAANNTTYDVFMYSSATSYCVTDDSRKGPYALGVYVSEEKTLNDQPVEARLVVFGNSEFVDANYAGVGLLPNNYKMVAASMSLLQDDIDQLYITSKSLLQNTVVTTQAAFLTGLGIFALLIPGAILAIGLIRWSKRRHA